VSIEKEGGFQPCLKKISSDGHLVSSALHRNLHSYECDRFCCRYRAEGLFVCFIIDIALSLTSECDPIISDYFPNFKSLLSVSL